MEKSVFWELANRYWENGPWPTFSYNGPLQNEAKKAVTELFPFGVILPGSRSGGIMYISRAGEETMFTWEGCNRESLSADYNPNFSRVDWENMAKAERSPLLKTNKTVFTGFHTYKGVRAEGLTPISLPI